MSFFLYEKINYIINLNISYNQLYKELIKIIIKYYNSVRYGNFLLNLFPDIFLTFLANSSIIPLPSPPRAWEYFTPL